MTDIKEHMEVIGADGVHIGTVDKVEGNRIKPRRGSRGKQGPSFGDWSRCGHNGTGKVSSLWPAYGLGLGARTASERYPQRAVMSLIRPSQFGQTA